MILVARAPFCLNFGGNGTDSPEYYERYGGFVISASIGFYVYVILSSDSNDGVRIISADYQAFSQGRTCESLLWENTLALPRAITRYFNIHDGVSVFLASQLPPGTGVSSAGSMAVAMIKGLAFWSGLDLGPAEVADLACTIEPEGLGLSVGKYDKYAAAFGGVNCVKFSKGTVDVQPLRLKPGMLSVLQENLMLFSINKPFSFSVAKKRQQAAVAKQDQEVLTRLHAMKAFTRQMGRVLAQGDLKEFGKLLHHSWIEERELTLDEVDPFAERCYQVAWEEGALGGKIIAGTLGGFLLLFCPVEHQHAVELALVSMGLHRRLFSLVDQGVQVFPLSESSPLQSWLHPTLEPQNAIG